MDPLIGQIAIFPWDWAPKGWAKCDGSLLPISRNQALYALIGCEFGGDWKTNFALPKMPPIQTENGGDLGYFIALEGYFPSRP
ncbi:MAG: tail fiber protein [Pseudanabaenaceae cyanobacterium bins.39]|nr:tail fiber protein [Pseudanabaenaceae cyanobacterium bins.39]